MSFKYKVRWEQGTDWASAEAGGFDEFNHAFPIACDLMRHIPIGAKVICEIQVEHHVEIGEPYLWKISPERIVTAVNRPDPDDELERIFYGLPLEGEETAVSDKT